MPAVAAKVGALKQKGVDVIVSGAENPDFETPDRVQNDVALIV